VPVGRDQPQPCQHVGGLGDLVPENPETAKTPEIPRTPRLLKTPEIPRTPRLLKTPEIPRTPRLLKTPMSLLTLKLP
jgi:hypothetical protein